MYIILFWCWNNHVACPWKIWNQPGRPTHATFLCKYPVRWTKLRAPLLCMLQSEIIFDLMLICFFMIHFSGAAMDLTCSIRAMAQANHVRWKPRSTITNNRRSASHRRQRRRFWIRSNKIQMQLLHRWYAQTFHSSYVFFSSSSHFFSSIFSVFQVLLWVWWQE